MQRHAGIRLPRKGVAQKLSDYSFGGTVRK
jgi:hypothetical protein